MGSCRNHNSQSGKQPINTWLNKLSLWHDWSDFAAAYPMNCRLPGPSQSSFYDIIWGHDLGDLTRKMHIKMSRKHAVGYYILEIINRHLCQSFCHYLVFKLKSHLYICCVCVYVCACAQSLRRVRLFATLWTGCNPLGFSVHEMFQARILEQVVISYSMGSSWARDWTHVSCISCIDMRFLYHWPSWKSVFLLVQNQMKSAWLSNLTDLTVRNVKCRPEFGESS